MTDLIKRDDALPAVTVETCWKCDGSGMAIGDGGDPRICNECKYDGVVPIDPVAIREAALVSAVAKQIGEEHGWVRREELEAAEAKLTKAEEERDGYLAERNKFQLYLQRTHADLELEVAAVEALNAKLTKAVAFIRRHIPDSVYEQRQRANAFLAELEKTE
jgi:hypothetical protein